MGLRQGDPIATSDSLCSSPVLEMPYKQNRVPVFCCVLSQCKRSRVLCRQSSVWNVLLVALGSSPRMP